MHYRYHHVSLDRLLATGGAYTFSIIARFDGTRPFRYSQGMAKAHDKPAYLPALQARELAAG